jgi:DNA (cytosine-5)-methyltransferase 1
MGRGASVASGGGVRDNYDRMSELEEASASALRGIYNKLVNPRMRVGSLFAGIGGFDLAARNVGWSTAWYSEIDPYACRVMQKHFPDAVNLGDITTITNPPAVDVLCGGFPCQDISYAGDGAGIAVGTRSGLWIEYARIIAEVRPRWVVAENVSALRTRGLGRVLRDLDALGYDTEWHCIPAAAVGAPHLRDRVWIVAHATGQREREQDNKANAFHAEGHARMVAGGNRHAVADASGKRGPRLVTRENLGIAGPWGVCSAEAVLGGDPFERGNRWPQPLLRRMDDGLSSRMDRLRCVGNAIVPQVAEIIFRAINDAEAMKAAA